MRAGMAGGSADAAAVLAGLNRLYGAHLTLPQLCEIGALVGADVPFALTGGTARVGGIGEQITPLCPVPACCRFVVVMPGGGVSTPQAFARYDRLGTREHPDCDALQRAIEQGDYRAVCGAMGNALMYSSSAGRTNRRICSLLRRAGADAALMTGSGAAVFGVFDSDERAEKAAALLRGAYRSVWVLRPCGAGTEILSEL